MSNTLGVAVTCDSTCDLSPELYEKYKIDVAPLYITTEETQHRDGIDISPDDIFAFVAETGKLPKTSAVSIIDYIRFFQSKLEENSQLIHVNISSHMSACNQNAIIAAKEIGENKVFVVDSLNLSTGSGHLAVMAAELAQKGKSAAEIKEILDEKAKKLEVSFLVDRLDFLYKGGRCSAVSALGANLLRLHPCIQVKNGEMGVGKKYRGNMLASLEQYVTERLKNRRDIDTKRIFITHSGCDDKIVSKISKLVSSLQPFNEVIITQAGCTISSHCGENTLGILFLVK